MEPDPQKQKAESLRALVSGPLASSAEKLSTHSRAIPSGKDFHFYNNFAEFRSPARGIAEKSQALLDRIGALGLLYGKQAQLPDDLDDGYEWLVNLNDDLYERFGVSMDEFKSSREMMEANGGKAGKMGSEDGFQVVCGKKKKKNGTDWSVLAGDEGALEECSPAVKVASKDKKTTAPRSKVPFHIHSIPRPQDEFHILVNNSNQPFQHVWLEWSEDGSRFVHPLEKLSVNDFVDGVVGEDEHVKPPPLENTPFTLVEGVKELTELASKLRDVNEFAIDLEHNQYRSFQGLTCLMQISTRTEDFVVDTLKLRVHIGPHLREAFKDPSKRKVMHGSDRDILWLQRDFGIYVCNLFDTGQASRVLQLERNSLEYLLHHFCDVTANKEYQNAEWRLRPIPDVMLKYAREDTHYLLYLYDVMTQKLLQMSSDSEHGSALLEVYKRSYDLCMQLYEKELLTDTSYLHIYGLREADFNAEQLAVAAGLCEWRDNVARAEDESTGYILPNRALLEIARQMPLSPSKLHRLVRSKHPFVERYLGQVTEIIKSSVQNTSAFESVVEELKKGRLETGPQLNNEAVCDGSESQAVADLNRGIPQTENVVSACGSPRVSVISSPGACISHLEPETIEQGNRGPAVNHFPGGRLISTSSCDLGSSCSDTARMAVEEHRGNGSSVSLKPTKVNVASVQLLKKPTGAFGALLGRSKRKPNRNLRESSIEQERTELKLDQIKSSVSLPFHSFSGKVLKQRQAEDAKPILFKHPEPQQCDSNFPSGATGLDEIITLENKTLGAHPSMETSTANNSFDQLAENSAADGFELEANVKDESMSLTELSSSFQKCFESINQTKRSTAMVKQTPSQDPDRFFELQPFDYDAARKQMNFTGDHQDGDAGDGDDGLKTSKGSRGRRKGSVSGIAQGEAPKADFQAPRRRQAFPPTGNRSATFR